MNKRIQELIDQCTERYTTYFDGRGNVSETFFDKQKFAELIVRECIDTVSDCSIEYCTRPQIVNEIKQYFGVEE